jgi:hypothetical protein
VATSKRQSLYVAGLPETLKAFRALPKEVKAASDQAIRDVTAFVASATIGAASTPAEQLAASTIKSQKNSVSLGGGGKRNRAGGMALGTEFGGQSRPRTMQFRPHRGREGYFFWPTIRDNSDQIKQMWDDLLEDAIQRAGFTDG